MTTMMVLMLLIHPLKYFENVNLKDKIKGYTFGSPPILSKHLENFLDGYLVNIVNQYDLITRLSFGSVRDLMKLILEFEDMEVFIKLHYFLLILYECIYIYIYMY